MTEQLTLKPDQHYRECGCPTWVLRCAHWGGQVLLAHEVSDTSPDRGCYICLREEEWPVNADELSEVNHGGEVVRWPADRADMEGMWPLVEADFLAGSL